MLSPGEIIKRARVTAGLTQAGLAERAGTRQSAISAYESGRRDPTVKTLERLLRAAGYEMSIALAPRATSASALPQADMRRQLAAHAEEIRSIVARHGGRRVWLFGSVARGEDDAESDIDLLVDLPERSGILRIGAIARDVERLLGVDVDVVPESALESAKRQLILAEAVEL